MIWGTPILGLSLRSVDTIDLKSQFGILLNWLAVGMS